MQLTVLPSSFLTFVHLHVTIAEAIHQAGERLRKAGVPAASFDAELLLRHVVGKDRAWVLAHGTETLPGEQQVSFDRAVSRREKREPLQHITGLQEFWGLEMAVSPDALIPRPETELVVETALHAAAEESSPLIIDLCTGSGCIAVSLAKHLPGARIFATDRSAAALSVARQNAQRHGVADRIRFLEGDLFGPLGELNIRGRADIITANPPYVRADDLPSLQPEVRDHEPTIALVAGPEGTEIAERIIEDAPAFLKRGGLLVMEMGMGQANQLSSMIFMNDAYEDLRLLQDLLEIERVIVAKKQ